MYKYNKIFTLKLKYFNGKGIFEDCFFLATHKTYNYVQISLKTLDIFLSLITLILKNIAICRKHGQ